jgi:hypothetical protein
MPARRLEDHIRELQSRLLNEKEPEKSETAHQLQLALRQHSWRLTNAALAVFASELSAEFSKERRKT